MNITQTMANIAILCDFTIVLWPRFLPTSTARNCDVSPRSYLILLYPLLLHLYKTFGHLLRKVCMHIQSGCGSKSLRCGDTDRIMASLTMVGKQVILYQVWVVPDDVRNWSAPWLLPPANLAISATLLRKRSDFRCLLLIHRRAKSEWTIR